MGQGREAGNDDQGGWGVGEVLSREERNLRGISKGNVKGILKGIIRGEEHHRHRTRGQYHEDGVTDGEMTHGRRFFKVTPQCHAVLGAAGRSARLIVIITRGTGVLRRPAIFVSSYLLALARYVLWRLHLGNPSGTQFAGRGVLASSQHHHTRNHRPGKSSINDRSSTAGIRSNPERTARSRETSRNPVTPTPTRLCLLVCTVSRRPPDPNPPFDMPPAQPAPRSRCLKPRRANPKEKLEKKIEEQERKKPK